MILVPESKQKYLHKWVLRSREEIEHQSLLWFVLHTSLIRLWDYLVNLPYTYKMFTHIYWSLLIYWYLLKLSLYLQVIHLELIFIKLIHVIFRNLNKIMFQNDQQYRHSTYINSSWKAAQLNNFARFWLDWPSQALLQLATDSLWFVVCRTSLTMPPWAILRSISFIEFPKCLCTSASVTSVIYCQKTYRQ